MLIPLFLALFLGFTILIIGPFSNYNFPSIFIFSSALALSDFFRAKVFSGFPWNLWAYSVSWSTEILQILNLLGLFAFNLIIITIFTLPSILFYKFDVTKKMFVLLFVSTFVIGLYLFGSYEINKNKVFLKNINKKINVKIISPNFKLEYGLNINQIKKKIKKVNKIQ